MTGPAASRNQTVAALKKLRREHYVPNQIARSSVMRESKTLGLIVPNIENLLRRVPKNY